MWKAQHESGSVIERKPTDAHGIKLMRECGYEWLNLNDGNGWQQIQFVERRAVQAERLAEVQS